VVIRFKARVVAKKYLQVKGVDFGKTFASVAKFNTIRVIFIIALAMGLKIYQIDVEIVLLNGKLDVDMYME
jgi:hypothetical protein